MNAPERFTLTMTRFIRAPREKVFDAFTSEAGLAAWMGPRGMRLRTAQVDAREGGAWRVDIQGREGYSMAVGGHYRSLQRPYALVFTWKWEGEQSPMPHLETLVEVQLQEKNGGTEMRMTHSGFPAAAAREGHSQGWVSTFNKRNDYLDDTMIRRYLLQVLIPRGPDGKPDQGVIAAALAEVPAQLGALEKAYSRSAYLAGSALSAADLFVAPVLAGLQFMPEGGRLMAGYPNLLRAQDLVRQRPSFTSTQPL